MSLLKALMSIFSDVPETEKAREIFDTILAGVKEGAIVAFRDADGEICYKHQVHTSRAEMARQLSPQELEQRNEEIVRQINAKFN